MNPAARFAAALLDATLGAQASDLALRLTERQLAPAAAFHELAADARVRLQYLAEAVALERAGLYLQHVDWLRATYAARGVAPGYLGAVQACQREVLGENLPPEAFARVEPILADEARLLAEPCAERGGALDGPRGPDVARLLELVLRGQREAAIRLAGERCASLGEEAFVQEILAGVQSELGRLWQLGEIHAGEEHLASHITEEILVRLGASGAPSAPPLGLRVLVAAVAGDLHDIGARMVARQFERHGWEVFFLGANLPVEDLLQAARDLGPELLALSVSLGLHARIAERVVGAAHALEPRLPVLVGGAPFRRVPDLWRVIGADAEAADARAAELAGRTLVGR